ncbi:hypothetical protein SIID45300_01487 [Candidatus Magnetaquicoccaceae bacterium FCR-1]|uniref:CheW-like domain-containing protein n=1 Tax=Candidatus Magnetaquiglobus chichijimensis TaxID=3141448 RepID=A0ABQ0C8F0_9PROT
MNDAATLDVVRFLAGGHPMALPAGQVRACRPIAPGSESEVTPIEPLLGLDRPDATADHRLLDVARGGTIVTWRVGGPVTLHALSRGDIHPLPPLLAARLAISGPRALALLLSEGDPNPAPILLIDAERIESSPR